LSTWGLSSSSQSHHSGQALWFSRDLSR